MRTSFAPVFKQAGERPALRSPRGTIAVLNQTSAIFSLHNRAAGRGHAFLMAEISRHALTDLRGTKSCPFKEMSTISGYVPNKARLTLWRQVSVERRRNGGAANLQRFEIRPFPIQSLALVVYSVLSSTFSEPYRKNCIDQWTITLQSRKRNFGRQSSTSSSCVRKAGKEGQIACQGTSRASFSERPAAQPKHWVKKSKEQASCACTRSRGNHRQSKAKEGKVEVRDLRGISVRSSRAQSQATARSIQTNNISRSMKSQVNT